MGGWYRETAAPETVAQDSRGKQQRETAVCDTAERRWQGDGTERQWHMKQSQWHMTQLGKTAWGDGNARQQGETMADEREGVVSLGDGTGIWWRNELKKVKWW